MNDSLKKKLSDLDLVIFDLDGTLIDSNGTHNYLDIELVRSLGDNKSSEEILQERDEFIRNSNTGDIYLNYCDYLKTKYNSVLSGKEILQFRRDLSKKISKDIKYKPDADKIIKYLKNQNIKLALATVSRKETIDIYINENENIKNKCNIKDYFDLIVTKDDVKLKKPNPEVYNKIIENFQINDLSRCVVVEDSLTGVLAAKNANLDVIVIYDEYSNKDREKINELADYNQCMAYTEQVDRAVLDVKGLLTALHLEGKIKIAFDEWNLRSWHHPNVHTIEQGIDSKTYLVPRDKNDDNSSYTMADAVFTACFLNAMNRHCDIVGMANFAPILNTRGCIYSYKDGLVLRSTYHVFDLYVNRLGDIVLDGWEEGEKNTITVFDKNGNQITTDTLDILATQHSRTGKISISVVNKEAEKKQKVKICLNENQKGRYRIQKYQIAGKSVDSYNDIDKKDVFIEGFPEEETDGVYEAVLLPHSINVFDFERIR